MYKKNSFLFLPAIHIYSEFTNSYYPQYKYDNYYEKYFVELQQIGFDLEKKKKNKKTLYDQNSLSTKQQKFLE